jgi:phytoene desaturase
MLLRTPALATDGPAGPGPGITPAGGDLARPAPPGEAPHAIVIGSGFGGLAAAVRLQAAGYRVTVLERLDAPGGRAYVHVRDGHVFDAGPTIVTAPHLLEELWQLAGRRFEDDIRLVPLDPFYRLRFDDGTHFDYSGDPARMRASVGALSPADLPGYDAFVREAERCFRLGFEDLGAKAFDTVGDLFAAVPALLKMRAWRSLHGMVARYVRHPKLRIVMSIQSLLIGGNPFAVTCVYSLIAAMERRWGVHWAIGGTGALVRGLVGLIEGRGGVLRCNATVAQIDVQAGAGRPRATGVRLASGERLAADLMVSNADTAWTYRHLVAPEHRRHWTDRRIAKARYSMSLFVWYFGTRRRFEGVPHHQMVLGPRYEGLLDDIFHRHVLAEDFSTYLHRPTATDPELAPPGHDTFYVLAPVPHLDSGTDWARMAEPFRHRLAKRLHDTVLPGFERELTASFVTTPLDFRERLLSVKGAAFGFEPVMRQSAWFRPHNRSEDIERLYFVGAGTHPGAGIPGVLSSAKALASVLPAAASLLPAR